MLIHCPLCGAKIGLDDVNVARDVALCRSCERTFSFADLVEVELPAEFPTEPPPGAWYDETADGFVAGATTRSADAFFHVPFTCFMAGGSLFGCYGTQIASHEFSLVLTLFGLPFLVLSVFLVTSAVMSLAGRVIVSVSGEEAEIFTGVGRFGFRKRFHWESVLFAVQASTSSGRHTTHEIRLTGAEPITFGANLKAARRLFLLGVLRRELRRRDSSLMFFTENHFAT